MPETGRCSKDERENMRVTVNCEDCPCVGWTCETHGFIYCTLSDEVKQFYGENDRQCADINDCPLDVVILKNGEKIKPVPLPPVATEDERIME